VAAFAAVPRERFLGPGPWQIPLGPRRFGEPWSYRSTRTSDPRHVYHNILIAIDRERELHNGLPSFLAFKIEAARVSFTDRVVHIGCGVGYYTAIMAELAREGSVVAIETDADLARRSRENLVPWKNVEVVSGDGTTYDPGYADVFFVNAGATHPSRVWLDRLAEFGRMILPLTYRDHQSSRGIVLLIDRGGQDDLSARTLCGISVFDCTGGRDSGFNAALGTALEREDSDEIRSLKPSDHPPAASCWAHLGDVCVSREPAA
jgi:protein-L-isoaspartate(D-aspartate) O-methyltransferase